MSPWITPDLESAGIPARHVQDLDMKGAPDRSVFDVALLLGYDAVVTKDHYRQPEERLDALRAMLDGLRIFRLTFSPTGPVRDIDATQLQLILAQRAEMERAIESASQTRLMVFNANTNAVTREQTVEQVAAELQARQARAMRGRTRR